MKITLRYVSVLNQVALVAVRGESAEDAPNKLARRWRSLSALDDELNDVIWLVRAQLGDTEANAIDQVWQLKVTRKAAQETSLQDREWHERTYSVEGVTKFKNDMTATVVEVRRLLSPHIRMASVNPRAP